MKVRVERIARYQRNGGVNKITVKTLLQENGRSTLDGSPCAVKGEVTAGTIIRRRGVSYRILEII